MANYLVTGAAGFIGSAIAKELLSNGNNVVTIDNLSTGICNNIPEGCVFIKGNDFDDDIIKQLDAYQFDAIIHIAGQSSGEVSFENPIYDLQTNTQSTIMLLDYAKKSGCKNFVYASSMAVYGDASVELVDESTTPMPKSFYAVGKLASENYMRIYSTFGIKCTALRFFNVFGIGQNMSNLKQGMASIFLAMAINNRRIIVKGTKDRFRDFVYIDDVVQAVMGAINRSKGNPFEIYNVSTGKKHTVEEVITEIGNNLPYTVDVEYTQGTPGDQHGVYGKNTKIFDDIGWYSQHDFKSGIKLMVDWALKKKGDNKMKITALLTGRGNNSLKDKNILDILGKPVLYYPANAAYKSDIIDDYYCSSDDAKILNAAKEIGYRPIVRPAELASPTAQHIDCIMHALKVMETENNLPDILIVVLANNVTIKSEWINECVNVMKHDMSVTAVVPVYEDNDHHPLRAKTLNQDGTLSMYEKNVTGKISTNRQDLPECLFLSHNFWVLNVDFLMSGIEGQQPWGFMGDKIVPYKIDESIDIHKEIDLYIANEWIKENYTD